MRLPCRNYNVAVRQSDQSLLYKNDNRFPGRWKPHEQWPGPHGYTAAPIRSIGLGALRINAGALSESSGG